MNQELAEYIERRLWEIKDDLQWQEQRLEKAEKELSRVTIYDSETNLTESFKDAQIKVERIKQRMEEHQMELDIFYTARDTKSES